MNIRTLKDLDFTGKRVVEEKKDKLEEKKPEEKK